MNVVLIGYRATGKSTVGKHLALKMNVRFFDTDALVEKKAGMPIADIIANHGWDFFREREKEAVRELEEQTGAVISTGGGVVLDQENVDLLKKNGFLIWLNAPLNDIITRLNTKRPGAVIRPQFTDWDIVEETIKTVNERYPLYEKAADYTVETTNKNIVKVGEEIYQYLVESGKLIKVLKKQNK